MASPILYFSPEAYEDMLGFRQYTHTTWSAAQADRYTEKLEHTCWMLVDTPHLGRALPEVEASLRVIRCDSHFIFYRVLRNRLVVIALLHERMDAVRHLAGRLQG